MEMVAGTGAYVGMLFTRLHLLGAKPLPPLARLAKCARRAAAVPLVS